MKTTQLTQGKQRRLMYLENKSGFIVEFAAHIGWVTFSKTGNTVYYRDLTLTKIKGGGISGNFKDAKTGDEYWISGVKKRGGDSHWAETTQVYIDEDAADEYRSVVETSKGSSPFMVRVASL